MQEEEYIPLEKLNKKQMNRLNPFEDLKEGKEFAKKVLYGTGKTLKATGQAAYGAVKETAHRVALAKQRSGFGIHQFGKGENFGIGTKRFGVKLNRANVMGYEPPQQKPKVVYRTRTKIKYIPKIIYKKRK